MDSTCIVLGIPLQAFPCCCTMGPLRTRNEGLFTMDGVLERLQSFDIPSMFASKAWPKKTRPGPTKQGLVEMET